VKGKIVVTFIIVFCCGVLLSKSSIIWKSSQIIGRPVKVIVNERGIFIADMKQVKIFQLDFKGKLVNEIGKQGEGPDEFTSLQDFVIYKNDLYVKSNSRIKCLTLNGKFKNRWDFTMKYTFHHFFVTEDGFILVGKIFEKDPKVYSKPYSSPYRFFHHISFEGKVIKSFGPSFAEYRKINIWNNLLILAGMTPLYNEKYIYYANHLNYQVWRASIKTGESKKLIDEEVPYFIPFSSRLKRFSSKGGTITKGDLFGTYIKLFKEEKSLIVFLKSGSWGNGYKSTYLRVYELTENGFKFKNEKKLENDLMIFSFYKGIFYGFNEDGDFVAVRLI